MNIVIGTKNQNKVHVVAGVFDDFFKTKTTVTGHDADSKVPEAPHDRETFQGALNRARECAKLNANADYCVVIESGLVERYGNYFEEAWAVIISKDGTEQIGYSSGLLLPKVVTNRMEAGQKHNQIMSELDEMLRSPNDNRDTWSRYTGGYISRTISLSEAVQNALVQSAPTELNLYKFTN